MVSRPETARLGRSPSVGRTACGWHRSTTTALASLVGLTALLLLAPTAWASGAIPDSGYVTNGEVKAIAHSGNITYIGGTFTEVGPATGPGVGINESTGADLGWARVWGGGGSISAVVSDGSGGYYIGGSFTEVAGHPAENLAHIKSSGEVDLGWLPKANGEVKALAVSGGIVYVGGTFTTIGTNNAEPRAHRRDQGERRRRRRRSHHVESKCHERRRQHARGFGWNRLRRRQLHGHRHQRPDPQTHRRDQGERRRRRRRSHHVETQRHRRRSQSAGGFGRNRLCRRHLHGHRHQRPDPQPHRRDQDKRHRGSHRRSHHVESKCDERRSQRAGGFG